MAKCIKICSGAMRHLITVEQQSTEAQEDSIIGGQAATPWETFTTIRGNARQVSGAEAQRQGVTTELENIRVETRYRSDITVEMRLQWDGRPWNIQRLENVDYRNKLLVIYASAGVPQ